MSDHFRHDFNKLNRLPPYILSEVTETRNAEAFAVNEGAKQSIIDAGGTIRHISSVGPGAQATSSQP